ncbi:MAG: amidohydrolase family protein, partial [Deltaproteobacteria bacterium]|nr:amidohydrolase family protein [Deltaproteobacteria bacterium]
DCGVYPVPHGSNAGDLSAMTRIGLTPMEAIMAGTKTAAEILHLDDRIGTIEPGKIADLIVVDGNPLDDITLLQKKNNIKIVMKAGKIFINRL